MKKLKRKLKAAWTQARKRSADLKRNRAARAKLRKHVEGLERERARTKTRRRELRDEERKPKLTDEQREQRMEAAADKVELLETRIDQGYEQLEGLASKGVRIRGKLLRQRKRVRRYKQRRAKIREQRRDKSKSSKWFAIAEADCKDGTPVPQGIEDELIEHYRKVLDPMREKFGRGTITSGFRTGGANGWNARVGGVPDSYHVYTERMTAPATDVVFAMDTPSQWGAEARRLLAASGGVGQYNRSGFVHVDRRGYVSIWYE